MKVVILEKTCVKEVKDKSEKHSEKKRNYL